MDLQSLFFFQFLQVSPEWHWTTFVWLAVHVPSWTQDELVHGVERLKGTAKGIDLAAFIMEHRTIAANQRVKPVKRCSRIWWIPFCLRVSRKKMQNLRALEMPSHISVMPKAQNLVGKLRSFIDLCTAFKVIFRRGSVTSLGLRSLRVKVTMMTDVQPLLSEGGLL